MKENILYVLYENDISKENHPDRDLKNLTVSNNNFYISIIKINPYKFHGFCGQRYNIVYVDSHFMDHSCGRELIENVFKPMASLGKDARLFLI